jgi:5-methylthioadenosine/S-adenosylhomocysteine deaminase
MLSVDFTIQGALVPAEQGYQTVDVRISQGRIAAIQSQLEPIGTLVNGHNKLLLPGFINAHTHSSELWQRGIIPPLPLELWLVSLYEFSPLDPEQVYLSAVGTAVETLLSGGTTVVDHLVLIPGRELETVAAAVRGYRETGIRAYIGPLIQDQELICSIPIGTNATAPVPGNQTTELVLSYFLEMVQQFHRPEDGIHIMAAPTGMQLCTDALFAGAVEISDRYNLCRHSHLLETKAQKILAQEKYGESAVRHLQKLGFLGAQTSLAHCVWLDQAEIDILAETESTVVHNPLSNLRLGSGIAPLLGYQAAGVNVTFGCDGASSNDSQDLLEAIKIGSILHSVTDFEYRRWITPRQAVKMASLGGAKGLGIADQVGSLEVGKDADLVLYDLTTLSLLPRTDPIGLLVLGRPVQAVDSVWVRGDRVVLEGKPVYVNLAGLREQLFERSQWIGDRVYKTMDQFEDQYRQIMNLQNSKS